MNEWVRVRTWFFLLEQALLVLAGVMLVMLALMR